MHRTFLSLAKELSLHIMHASGQKGIARYVPNGPLSSNVQLACAICWFVGGSPHDIMTMYGIGHMDTINSCWYVVMPSTDIQGLMLCTQTIMISSDL